MDSIKKHFIRIFRRDPSDDEFSYWVDTVNTLGIGENDEFLVMLMAISRINDDAQARATNTIKVLKNKFVEVSKAHAAEYEAQNKKYESQIKACNAETEKEHKRIQSDFVEEMAKTLKSAKNENAEFVNGLKDSLLKCKDTHDIFLKGLDEKLEKSLMAKVGDVINTASKKATTRLQWFIICTTIVIITSLFFGTFLYSANLAYKKGLLAGSHMSGSLANNPVVADVVKYDPKIAEKILRCEWPGWIKSNEKGRLVCKPSVSMQNGTIEWIMPEF